MGQLWVFGVCVVCVWCDVWCDVHCTSEMENAVLQSPMDKKSPRAWSSFAVVFRIT